MFFSTYQRLKSWLNQDDRQWDHRPQVMQELEPRWLLSAVLTDAVPDQFIPASGGTTVIDLNQFFDDTDITGTLVRFDTVYGTFDVEMFDDDTPVTVENFLDYVDSGAYDDTFIHRNALNEDDSPFVVQGGGYYYEAPNSYLEVTEGNSILNEPGISNTRGTIAMAKLSGDEDSATNQWFFNMADNSSILDDQNGGFTAFGEVLGDGMDIVDQIAATPVWDASSINSAFGDLPLIDFTNDHYPNENDLVWINSVTRLEQELSFSFVSSSEPTRVLATVSNTGELTIFTVGTSQPETVTITIEAEDYDGNTTQTTITVVVGAAKESMDGDASADLMWRNFSNGKNTVWDMSDFTLNNADALDQVSDTTWYIAAVGDFNQDGSNDLLWRNAYDGQNKVWLMNGHDLDSVVDLRTVPDTNWVVGGIEDFDKDGNVDILWRHQTKGRTVVWTMDGTSETGNFVVNRQAGSAWYIVGVGDFNRDGAVDMAFHNEDTGQNKIMLLNTDGTLKSSVALLTQGNTSWVATAVADYDSDNQVDILWRNVNNGRQMVWVMNGTLVESVNRDIKMLRNRDWQLPGKTSQMVAESQAMTRIQRQNARATRLAKARVSAGSASALALAATQASQEPQSVLNMVEPIITLDGGGDEASDVY